MIKISFIVSQSFTHANMILIDFNLCKDIRWMLNLYEADGHYIEECYKQNKNKHIYVNNTLCYYNYLTEF